jgi:hypothetical protein
MENPRTKREGVKPSPTGIEEKRAGINPAPTKI